MTEHNDDFDRSLTERLRAYEHRVPGGAAPNLDASGSGASSGRRTGWGWGALVATAGGAAGLLLVLAIGGRLSPPTAQATATPSPGSPQPAVRYEAVFLRKDMSGGSADMLVVGVDGEGNEREIARLRGAAPGYGPAAPTGAVDLGGLLALPRMAVGDSLFHWEIVDLHHPEAAPIVVAGILEDADMLRVPPYIAPDGRGGVFWGPGEQVAIGWYVRGAGGGGNATHVTFVDGRTGAASSVEVPGGMEPYWMSDGSGVFLGRRIEAGSYVFAFLLRDGTVATSGTTQIVYSGTSRRYRSDGVDVSDAGLPLAGLDISDTAWTAEGDGVWLAIHSPGDGHELTIQRLVSPSARQTMATLRDAVGELATSRPQGHFVGIAPDDSVMVLSMHSVVEDAGGESVEGRSRAVVNPASGAWFVIEGSFVGWLAVDR